MDIQDIRIGTSKWLIKHPMSDQKVENTRNPGQEEDQIITILILTEIGLGKHKWKHNSAPYNI